MGKRDKFWSNIPEQEDGQILWPDDPSERAALVRSAFGAEVIGALEAILAEQLQIADGVPPEPGQDNYQNEASRRSVLAAMTEEQRREVRRLLRDACFGTLYWILVKLEHFPSGDVDFTVEPFGPDEKVYERIGIEETELHHLYHEWLDRFADLAKE